MSDRPLPLLIVDDDPVFALLVQQLLESIGPELPCAPEWVNSAAAALERVKGGGIELVLLDYSLPDANGLYVLEQIHRLPDTQRPAVIMLTASGNEAVAVEAMKSGAKDYLSKVDLDVPPLVRALKTALAQKQLAEQVERFNAEMKSDLQLARNLQQAMLPRSYPSFPAGSGGSSRLRFAHRYLTTAMLGGDFFTIQRLSDLRAGIFICDVMGHGVRSALVTAMLRAMVVDLLAHMDDPGLFLEEMNRNLRGILKQTESPMFATACCVVADVEQGTLRYANAAHEHPIRLQSAAGNAEPLAMGLGSGPALGLFEDAAFPTHECGFRTNDRLLFYTDGLIELSSADSPEGFGLQRLLRAAHECMGLALPQLCDELIRRVRTFAGGHEFEDDVCVVAMEADGIGPVPVAKRAGR